VAQNNKNTVSWQKKENTLQQIETVVSLYFFVGTEVKHEMLSVQKTKRF